MNSKVLSSSGAKLSVGSMACLRQRNREKEAIKLLLENSTKGQRGGAEPQDAELSAAVPELLRFSTLTAKIWLRSFRSAASCKLRSNGIRLQLPASGSALPRRALGCCAAWA